MNNHVALMEMTSDRTVSDRVVAQTPPITGNPPPSAMDKRNYIVGILLLLVVVLFWTLSSFLTQGLFDEGYNKPFFITYVNTSSFTLYLIPWLISRWRRRGLQNESRGQYQALLSSEPNVARPPSPRTTEMQDEMEDIDKPVDGSEGSLPPLTVRQTINLASVFCFFWFIANWTVNSSLGYTSVGSSTVLASTSGLFTLGVSRLLGVENFTVSKAAAVVTSLLGVTLVSLADSSFSSPTASPESRPPPSNPLLGDFLALISALFYALYVVLLKVRIKDESRINMQLFFGFVGFFNVICCLPVGVAIHFLGIEPFEFPSTRKTVWGIIINAAVTLSSDFIYVIAMLKTTPLVVTIGLSLTIPLAVLGDLFLGRSATAIGLLGAVLVLISFGVVGLEDAQQEALPEPLVPVADLEEAMDGDGLVRSSIMSLIEERTGSFDEQERRPARHSRAATSPS